MNSQGAGDPRALIRRIVGIAFVVGVLAAPFVALIYGFGIGLLMMTFALLATAWIAWDTIRITDPRMHRRIMLLTWVNLLLALLCAVGALVRLT